MIILVLVAVLLRPWEILGDGEPTDPDRPVAASPVAKPSSPGNSRDDTDIPSDLTDPPGVLPPVAEPLPQPEDIDVAPGSVQTTDPADAGRDKTPAGQWNLSGKADVLATHFGGSDADQITDLAGTAEGGIVVCGLLGSADGLPKGLSPTRFLADKIGQGHGFVGKLSADMKTWVYFSVFPPDTFQPNRLAVAPDGSVALAGKQLSQLPGYRPDLDWSKSEAAIAKVSADGKKLEWINPGGPNQAEATGLAVDGTGRVYWTAGTRGAGMAAYLLRYKPDGSEYAKWSHEESRGWCVGLDKDDKQLNEPGQFWHYYKKGWLENDKDGFHDYDGPGGWAPVKFWVKGIRQGGQVIVLPDGDIVVTGTMQYDFQVKGKRGFPAFDLLVARYSPTGKLRWSTNCYQPNDSVHTPDQKAADLIYDSVSGDIFVSAWQHGSNQYRFLGKLVGDTGNLSIFWVGRIDGKLGTLKAGWYLHNPQPKGNFSGWASNGIPKGWPKLSGNSITRLASDAKGRIYVTGQGATITWTTPNAHQDWPGQSWGRYGMLYVLSPYLDRVHYASVFRGTQKNRDGGIAGSSKFSGLAVTKDGVILGGWADSPGFDHGPQPAWAGKSLIDNNKDAALVRIKW